MNTRYKYFAIIILCGFLTPFCAIDDDTICGGFSPSYFDIEGLELNEFIQDSRPYLTNNNADTTFEFASDAAVILDLTYVVEYVSEPSNSNSNWNELFNPTLLACSPIFGGGGSKEERHAGMTVTTLLDYTSVFPAGSIINDEVLVGEYPSGNINSPLDSLARDTSLIQGQRLAMLIPSPPSADTMQLLIKLNLSTGEMYEVTTPRFVYTR